MCKVLAVSGVKSSKTPELWKFVKTVTPFMTPHDKDGVGYAALTRDGELFGERWLNPADAFKRRQEFTTKDQELLDTFKGALSTTVKYNKFGELKQDETSAVILHTRMATCDINIENTHPFVRDNTALIHNGVIRNTTMLKQLTSTCDSECILNEYADQSVQENPDAIELVADRLQGYYACAVLTQTPEGRSVMDIFRDDGNAALWACFIKQLDAVVFCTRAEIVKAACKELKWTVLSTLYVEPNKLLRLDAVTGEHISNHSFEATSKWITAARSKTHGYGANGWSLAD